MINICYGITSYIIIIIGLLSVLSVFPQRRWKLRVVYIIFYILIAGGIAWEAQDSTRGFVTDLQMIINPVINLLLLKIFYKICYRSSLLWLWLYNMTTDLLRIPLLTIRGVYEKTDVMHTNVLGGRNYWECIWNLLIIFIFIFVYRKWKTQIQIFVKKIENSWKTALFILCIDISALFLVMWMAGFFDGGYYSNFNLISVNTALMDEKSMDKSLLDRNVIESENHVFGSYDGIYLKYNTTEGENSFDQRIYLLCPEEYRVLTLYIGNTISKEEAYKFAENIVITEEDEMIKTADMITWSDIIEPTVYADKIDVTNGQLSVRQIGEAFNLDSYAEDNNGNNITTDKVTACVDKIQIADNLQLLDSDKIPKAWKTAVDANGKLVQNHLSYIKKGDGVNNLDSVVREENMDQKLLFLTVTYTNISEEELNHMLYLGTLIALSKQNDGTYTIYMPGTEAGEDYDYYISDSVAKTAEMTYSSVQDDYGQGKNYIPSLKPGESVQVNMAWIVNEKDIKNLYLNLNGTGGCYEITENMCHTGVVYVGKE